MPNGARKWCFTLNNYTDEDMLMLSTLFPDTVKYLIYGREVGANGTPHLQGFVWFSTQRTFARAKEALGQRVHLEVCRGTPAQNRTYCSKDGDFDEFGSLETDAGARTDWHDLKEWLKGLPSAPSDLEILEAFPSLWGRFPRACRDFRHHLCPLGVIVQGDLREWQVDLAGLLAEEPDDRKVIFVVDYLGGKGKTWFQKKLLMEGSDDCQSVLCGKRDDMAYSIEVRKKIYMLNVPRGQMEYLQYSVLEMLKDGIVHSPKYESVTKFIGNPCHVVVFSNEAPDFGRLTEDRYHIINI
jgi:hypothetical protein